MSYIILDNTDTFFLVMADEMDEDDVAFVLGMYGVSNDDIDVRDLLSMLED